MYLSITSNLPSSRRNSVSIYWYVLLIVTKNREATCTDFFVKSSAWHKYTFKNTGQRKMLELESVWIWSGRWSGQSILPPDTGIKIAAWSWRKRCWLSVHNKVKSGCFAVTSAKRVAVFQTSLKLGKRPEPNSLTRVINVWHPKDQNIYMKEGIVNKNNALI